MTSFKRLRELHEAQQKKRADAAELLKRKPSPAPTRGPIEDVSVKEQPSRSPPIPSQIAVRAGRAGVTLYRDDETVESPSSQALRTLVDLYLHAAQHRTRHIFRVWRGGGGNDRGRP